MLDQLESRRLLSVSFNPSTGLLTVTGSDRANVIRLIQDGATLRVRVDSSNTTALLTFRRSALPAFSGGLVSGLVVLDDRGDVFNPGLL